MPGAENGGLEAGLLKAVAEAAETRPLRDALRWFSSARRWLDERHLELCRIPAPTFQEDERADWMLGEFRKLGWTAEKDKAGNVLASARNAAAHRVVALTAHLDTVLAPRMPEDVKLGSDGRFIGPGVADNGAGLAALLGVAGALSEFPLEESPTGLSLVANVGEEGEGNLSGMRYLCRSSSLGARAAAFLVLDGPSIEHITCRAVGSRRFEVTVTGPGGHSWSDSGMANPVHALSRAVTLVSDALSNGNRSLTTGIPPGERASFNFGLIEGGTSVNAIATHARAKVDFRSEDPARIEALASLLAVSVEKAIESENQQSSGSRVAARIRQIGARPGGRLSDDAPMVQRIRAVDAYLGIRSKLDSASTDANVPLSLGLQALSIGAGGEGGGAHTPSEWFHPRGREIGLRRIMLMLALLMKNAGPASTGAV